MREIMPAENIFLITNKENYFNAYNQIREIDNNYQKESVLVEPLSLNTMPAITCAVKHLAEKAKISVDDSIIFLPSDHYIGAKEKYLELIKTAMSEIDGHIGTIGVTPRSPETGLGYIKKGERINNYYKVFEFKEKPDAETAANYVNSGEYVWNAGMYIFTIRTFVREIYEHAPDIYNLIIKNFEYFIENFKNLPSTSIDYAISEKSKNVVVFEGEFDWSDIGSFEALAEILIRTNRVNSRHISIDSKNIYVHSEGNKVIATIGAEDMIVIENKDSILIQKKGRGEDVRRVVEALKEKKIKELEHNLIVHRPWGKYEILINEPRNKVKKITVYPGAKLSLQSHFHRVEHWIVIKGTAKIINADAEILLKENESTFIPSLTKHRLENPGKLNLEIIEVQTGEYLEEDDIKRYDDIYNRSV